MDSIYKVFHGGWKRCLEVRLIDEVIGPLKAKPHNSVRCEAPPYLIQIQNTVRAGILVCQTIA